MRTIAIEYKSLGIRRSLTGSIPTRWNEVTPKQLIAISRNYLNEVSDAQMLSILTGFSKNVVKRLDHYQQFQLANELCFLTDYKPFSHFIITKLGILHAPKARLQDMCFGQFMFADSYYSEWLQSQKEADLNKFISALFRPEGKEFKEDNLRVYELITSRYPKDIKCAISINYRLVKEFLINAYPSVFQKAPESSKQKGDSGWVRVFESVVGDDIINQDKYAALPVHVVLRWITKKVKENAKR